MARITAWAEHKMTDARGRVGFLEQLVRYLRQHYPETWRAELERMLRELFPDRWQSLMALWEARESWETWLNDNRNDLARMTPEERRARMWEVRRDFFGDETDELFAAVRRNESLADALQAIDRDREHSVPERFAQLTEAVGEAYGDDAPSFINARRQELLDRFVGLESVQTDLAALDPEARYAQLRQVRTVAGMDDEALTRWDDLDRVRDQRRAAGSEYQQARAAATAALAGEALEARLSALRAQYFGEEATIIANEEASGFFRFETPQVYGRD